MNLVTYAKEIVGLMVSPLGVVDEKKKLRVIHDLLFGGGATVKKEKWMMEPETTRES